ncbi:hypothetical protein ABK040_013108 [Willaertia magna]
MGTVCVVDGRQLENVLKFLVGRPQFNNEPFILIFQSSRNRHNNNNAVPKKELLIKNLNVIDVKVSHLHCIILDNSGKVYYLKNELKERIIDKFIDGDATCQPQLINFTIEDPIKKIFGKNGCMSILLSRKGNIYVLGNEANDTLQINKYLEDGIKFNKEFIYNENVIEAACGESYFLLLTETGKVFGFGSNNMDCGGYGLIIITKQNKVFASGNFNGLDKKYQNFTEIDLKQLIGNNNHIVFSNRFELKARAGIYYTVFFTKSESKAICEIFNFKNCWKIYDVTFIL